MGVRLIVAAVALVLLAEQAASMFPLPWHKALRQSDCSAHPAFQSGLSAECQAVLNDTDFVSGNLNQGHLDALCVEDCLGPVYEAFAECIPDSADYFVLYCSKNAQDMLCGSLLTMETVGGFINETIQVGYDCGGANYTACGDQCKTDLGGLLDQYGCCLEDIYKLVEGTGLLVIPDGVLLPHFDGSDSSSDFGDLWVDCGLTDPGICPTPDGIPNTTMATTVTDAAATTSAGATVIVLLLAALLML